MSSVRLGKTSCQRKRPVCFVEAHQDAAVALVGGIARVAVVGADIDAAPGDDGRGMGFGAEFSRPFDVPAGLGVEGIGQAALVRDHVAGPGLAPLRLVGGAGGKAQRAAASAVSHTGTAAFGSSFAAAKGSQ